MQAFEGEKKERKKDRESERFRDKSMMHYTLTEYWS